MSNEKLYQKSSKYILDSIDHSNYFYGNLTNASKLEFLHDIFMEQYGYYRIKPYKGLTKQLAFKEWLSNKSSCFKIAKSEKDIVSLFENWENIKLCNDDKDKIIFNYFNFITSKVFSLFRKYDII
ncbi:MAG: hypothetical protein GY853_01630 [PVC group bacterium]|nr:hypothetical protein [PVC group bacterium]